MGELIWCSVTGRTQVFQNHPESNHPDKITSTVMKPVCLFVILAVTFNLGSALQCYVFNSHSDLGCNSYGEDGLFKGDDKLVQTCGAGEDQSCRKIYQMIRDEESVVRTCGSTVPEEGRECYTTVLEEYNTLVCSCTGSKCNSATTHGYSVATLATALLTAALAFFGKF